MDFFHTLLDGCAPPRYNPELEGNLRSIEHHQPGKGVLNMYGRDTGRGGLVAQEVETEASRSMIANIRHYGNRFGPLKEGEIPKTLITMSCAIARQTHKGG